MNELKSYSLFEGYEKANGKGYQTKRSEEKRLSSTRAKQLLAEYEKSIEEGVELTSEDWKRYRSLKQRYKVKKKIVDSNELRIPFFDDDKTIRYIREKNCFNKKWINKYGRELIEARIAEYKKLLHKKPEGVIYWNPFTTFK